ncbi:MAG: prepilin-type N-terminal cleavage/methylation domain-containing protein [bacterium]|nr:prepilin-type N-terminal cleavage/methylation domain-containing protein [bacterium]MDZ4284569.1 prepilin-type N-terminal cleavage/methylation domain-containing protein [Patescibacteria group bacterium]
MRGFTLIEILISVAVIAILASIATISFTGLRERQALSIGVEEVRTLLSRARARTLAAEDDSVFGLHITTSSVTLFRGVTYNPAAGDNELHVLDSLVTISAHALAGGGADVVFDKRTGMTSDYGTITVALASDVSENKVITIAQTGLVE